jgi:glycosyltransferase 2 family protein
MKGTILRVLVSISFIALLVYLMRDDFPVIAKTLRGADKSLILLSTAIFMSTVFLLAWRLRIIFRSSGLQIRFGQAVNLTFIGYFFNNFLPTSVGGDIVKAMCAARITGEAVSSVTSVVMDRIFGLFTFVLIPSISILFLSSMGNPAVPVVVYSFLGFSIFCFLLLFNRDLARRFHFVEAALNFVKLGQKFRKIYDGLHSFRNRKKIVFQSMLLSIVGQSVSIFVLYLVALSLGAERKTCIYFFILVPVVHLLSMLPSLNGLGIREGAYIYFLKGQIGADKAAALSILYLALLFFLSIIGGLIYLLKPGYHIRFKKQSGMSVAPNLDGVQKGDCDGLTYKRGDL